MRTAPPWMRKTPPPTRLNNNRDNNKARGVRSTAGFIAFQKYALITIAEAVTYITGSAFGFGLARSGGPEGIRTHDLSDANRTLSQLSYRPKSNTYYTQSPHVCQELILPFCAICVFKLVNFWLPH